MPTRMTREKRGVVRRPAAVVVAVLLLSLSCAAAEQGDPQPDFAKIEASIGGRLGIAAIHVEDGRRVSFNGGLLFPMASVRKLPIAMAVLARVDEGTEQLDRRIAVELGDVLASDGTPLGARLQAGSVVTVRALLELMMMYSDNTSSATVQRAAASAPLTQARLRALGITGVHVDREPRVLLRDAAMIQRMTGPSRSAAMARLEADSRDAAAPDAMADLLVLLQRGLALSPASTELLLGIMRRCETGPRRLRAGLPQPVGLAHKTGTLARTTNDVGIATLPDGTHLAIAVFVTAAQIPIPQREDAIAAATRAIYALFPGATVGRTYP